VRPQPPDPEHTSEPPAGFHEEWVELPDRRHATAEERQRNCRRPGCRRRPVMALLRSNGWWLYCDWHLYGSRVTEDGRIVSRRFVPTEAEGGA